MAKKNEFITKFKFVEFIPFTDHFVASLHNKITLTWLTVTHRYEPDFYVNHSANRN